MKICPFYAESIQDLAIKCRYCGESLSSANAPPIQAAIAKVEVQVAVQKVNELLASKETVEALKAAGRLKQLIQSSSNRQEFTAELASADQAIRQVQKANPVAAVVAVFSGYRPSRAFITIILLLAYDMSSRVIPTTRVT